MFTHYHNAFRYLEGLLANLPRQADYMRDRENPEIFLKRMRYFLSLIGNPDKDMKFIHITGTAGKGTVSSTVKEIMYRSGKTVGLFTSPFVQTAIEKIQVNDLYISPDEFVSIVTFLKPYIDRAYKEGPYGCPSYFELFFAIALIYFKQQKCDWIVLEVGLGGRYDCTNVIENPLVTAITNIDYDHTEILGKTLTKIAYDKAGIIKKGSMFVTSEQRPHIKKILKRECKLHNVLFNFCGGKDYTERNKNLIKGIIQSIDGNIDTHVKVQLPARFEIVQHHPTVVLDGAHNPIKIQTVLRNMNALSYKNLYLILGMADRKDMYESLKDVVSKAHRVYITRFQNPLRKCIPPLEIQESIRNKIDTSHVEMYLDPHQALNNALQQAGRDDLVLVTGSFFLTGELRDRWIPEEYILSARKSF